MRSTRSRNLVSRNGTMPGRERWRISLPRPLLPQGKILFLDDDIRLADALFQGELHAVDSRAISEFLAGPAPADSIVGAEYIGRADIYDVEHAKQALELDSRQSGPRVVYRTVPAYQGDQRDESLAGDIPISGAFLLMDGQAVRRAPIPHSYNEDCAFTAVLQSYGYRVDVAPFKPLHTGDEKYIRWRTALIQQVGAVVQKALEQALGEVGIVDLTVLVDRAVGHCEYHASASVAAWKKLFSDSSRQFGEVHYSNMYALVDYERIVRGAQATIVAYFRQWDGWQKLVKDPEVSTYIRGFAAGILSIPLREGSVESPLLARRLAVDSHAPPDIRINGVVRNLDAFYEAFGVQPGDRLYLDPAERVRLWGPGSSLAAVSGSSEVDAAISHAEGPALGNRPRSTPWQRATGATAAESPPERSQTPTYKYGCCGPTTGVSNAR